MSDYDQEIPQSLNADQPMALRGRVTEHIQDILKIIKVKKSALLIAKLERTHNNAQKKRQRTSTTNGKHIK